MFRLVPISLLLTLASAASAQTSAPTLEERMSQAEFHAAGLDKLSPEELAQLNAWLHAHGGATATPRGSHGKPLFYPDDADRAPVNAHIAGTFTGWRGKTVFRLDNGQEWQQAESGSYNAGEFTNPGVTIKPMILGSWLMSVQGCGCSVRVQRIK
ncbi:MAG: hypothetical protein GXC76_16090 [Rhodanobacteraceae bacterium]|nr:hypothetical protein [Rhodanobacteraceae bacterium]